MMRLNKLPEKPELLSKGLREMEEKDVKAVQDLWGRYSQRFKMVPEMSEEEVRHTFLSGLGTGDVIDGRREGQVIWAYVVEVGVLLGSRDMAMTDIRRQQNPNTHRITDFFSFYSLPSTIMKSTKYNLLEAAYLCYYGTDAAFEEGAEASGRLKKHLQELIKDALIVAEQVTQHFL
jgi:glycylpeptide N-tetradecanoyltransferase